MSAMERSAVETPRAVAIFLSTSFTRLLSFLTGPVSPVSIATTAPLPISAINNTPLGAKLMRPIRLMETVPI